MEEELEEGLPLEKRVQNITQEEQSVLKLWFTPVNPQWISMKHSVICVFVFSISGLWTIFKTHDQEPWKYLLYWYIEEFKSPWHYKKKILSKVMVQEINVEAV